MNIPYKPHRLFPLFPFEYRCIFRSIKKTSEKKTKETLAFGFCCYFFSDYKISKNEHVRHCTCLWAKGKRANPNRQCISWGMFILSELSNSITINYYHISPRDSMSTYTQEIQVDPSLPLGRIGNPCDPCMIPKDPPLRLADWICRVYIYTNICVVI